jgi:glycosyltransferase involved in cell wall biosynthesis
VATYARWKGQEVFLEAAAQVLQAAAGRSVRFYIVGGPIYQTAGSQYTEAELRTKAAELGIAAHVGFIAFQRDPANVYRGLDVVVHASTQPEPFGLTIVEGMACARPVIVSQEGGAAELFTPGYDAVGVRPRDPAALAAAIGELLHDPERCQRLAANARQTAIRRFSRTRLGPQLLAIYRRHAAPQG